MLLTVFWALRHQRYRYVPLWLRFGVVISHTDIKVFLSRAFAGFLLAISVRGTIWSFFLIYLQQSVLQMNYIFSFSLSSSRFAFDSWLASRMIFLNGQQWPVSLVIYCRLNIDRLIAVAERPSVFELTFSFILNIPHRCWLKSTAPFIGLSHLRCDGDGVCQSVCSRGRCPADTNGFALLLKHAMCASSWDSRQRSY